MSVCLYVGKWLGHWTNRAGVLQGFDGALLREGGSIFFILPLFRVGLFYVKHKKNRSEWPHVVKSKSDLRKLVQKCRGQT